MKKDTNPGEEPQKNYELKSEAVEDLVDEEVPEYSPEELARYRSTRRVRIPEVLKILLLKAWFAGAVCYFIVWGLAFYLPGVVEQMFVLSVAMGMVVDLLLNNLIRFLEKTPGDHDRWLFITRKGVVGLGLNLLYGFAVVLSVYGLYDGINRIAMSVTGKEGTIFLGVEPLLFGLFCMGFDMLYIGAKGLIRRIVRDAMQKAKSNDRIH